jgi:hypothetical protein
MAYNWRILKFDSEVERRWRSKEVARDKKCTDENRMALEKTDILRGRL